MQLGTSCSLPRKNKVCEKKRNNNAGRNIKDNA